MTIQNYTNSKFDHLAGIRMYMDFIKEHEDVYIKAYGGIESYKKYCWGFMERLMEKASSLDFMAPEAVNIFSEYIFSLYKELEGNREGAPSLSKINSCVHEGLMKKYNCDSAESLAATLAKIQARKLEELYS